MLGQLEHVMNFIGCRDALYSEAVDAQRMLAQVIRPEASPSGIVSALAR